MRCARTPLVRFLAVVCTCVEYSFNEIQATVMVRETSDKQIFKDFSRKLFRNSWTTVSYTQFTDVFATSFHIYFLEVREQIIYGTIISLIRKVVGEK